MDYSLHQFLKRLQNQRGHTHQNLIIVYSLKGDFGQILKLISISKTEKAMPTKTGLHAFDTHSIFELILFHSIFDYHGL